MPEWRNTTKEHHHANAGKDHLSRMRTVDTPVGKYGVTRHNLWSRPPSIQSSIALTLEFLGPPNIILFNPSFSFFKILPKLVTSWKLAENFAKLSKGCFSRSHAGFVLIQFLFTISSPWTPWSKLQIINYLLITLAATIRCSESR